MAGVLKYLNVELNLQTDNFNANIRAAQKELKELEKTVKPSLILFKDLGFAATGAATAIVGSLVAAAKSAADYGDQMRDASIRTGLATQALGGIKLAADQSGTSFEELQNGLKRFSVNINAAAQGTKQQVAVFERFGVSIKDAHGQIRPFQDILGDVAEKFKGMPEGVNKTAAAVELFGKNGASAIEFLSLGKAGLQEFQERAERLGIAVGQDFADASDKFNDSLNDIKAATQGLTVVIGNALLPAMTSLAVKITDTIVAFKNFLNAHPALIDASIKLAEVLGTGGALFLGLAGLLIIIPKLAFAWDALTVAMAANPIGLIAVGVATAVTALVVFRNEIEGGLTLALSKMVKGIQVVLDGASKLAGAAGLTGLSSKLSASGNAFKRTADDFADMSKVFLAGAPIITDNTSRIDAFRTAHQKVPPVLNATSDAAKKVTDAFLKSLKPADDLNDDLGILLKRFNEHDVVSVFAKKIVDSAKAQREHGYEVTGSVAALEQEAIAFVAASEAAETLNKAMEKAAKIRALIRPITIDVNDQALRDSLENIPEIPLQKSPIKIDLGPINTGAVVGLSKVSADAQDKIANLSERIRELQAANIPANRIMAVYGDEISAAAQDAKKFGLQLPENVNQLNRMQDATKRSEDEAKKWRDVWVQAQGKVVSSFVDGISNMVFHATKFSLDIIGIFKSIGETIFKTVLTDLSTKFTKTISDTILGQNGLGGVLSKIPGVGSVLGNIGGGAASTATNAAGAVGGAGSSIGSSISSVLSSGGVVGGLISGGISAAGSLLGSMRLEGTMNAVEYNTRASRIHLEVIIDQLLWPMKFASENLYTINYYAQYVAERMDALVDGVKALSGLAAAAPAIPTVATPTTIQVQSAGLDFSPFRKAVDAFKDIVDAIASIVKDFGAFVTKFGDAMPSFDFAPLNKAVNLFSGAVDGIAATIRDFGGFVSALKEVKMPRLQIPMQPTQGDELQPVFKFSLTRPESNSRLEDIAERILRLMTPNASQPIMANAVASTIQPPDFNIYNTIEINVSSNEDLSDPSVFDRKIMQPIDRGIMTGARGYRQRWSTALSQNAGNISTSPIAG